MIEKLAISNFRSIDKMVVIDFSMNNVKYNKEYSKLITKCKDEKISRVNFFYGKNGAGKSTIIHALKYLKSLALESNYEPESSYFMFKYNVPKITPFKLLNKIKEESFLSITYCINDNKYRYSVTYNNKESLISDERLEVYIYDSYELVYSKINKIYNDFTEVELERLKTYKIDFVSILSIVNEKINVSSPSLKVYLNDSFLFFKNLSFSFDSFDDDESLNYLLNDKTYLNKIIKEVKKFDISIDDIKIDRREINYEEYFKRFEDIVVNSNNERDKQIIEYIKNRYESEKYEFKLEFIHNKKSLSFNDESDGTINILNILFSLIASQKSIWVIDDFENYLHTEAVLELIKYISKGFNSKQFLLVTHELDILDLNEVKFKPVHFFVEKDKLSLSTNIVNLSDFKDLRVDERNSWKKFYQNYRLGQYPEITISNNITNEMEDNKDANQ